MSLAVLPSILATVESGRARHRVVFFAAGRFPAAQIAEELSAAIEGGIAAVICATREHLAELEARGADGSGVLRIDAGELAQVVLRGESSAKQSFNELFVAPILAALEGSPRARVFSELSGVLSGAGAHGIALAIERWQSELIEERPIELLCAHRLESFSAADSVPSFRAICDEHGDVELAGEAKQGGNRRLVAELEQAALALAAARNRLQLLADASARISAAKLDADQILEVLAHEVTRAGFADRCEISLRTEEGSTPSLDRVRDLDPDAAPALEQARQISGSVSVSLRAAGRPLGTLTATRRHPSPPFTTEDERLLADLADRAALSLENALLYRRVQRERDRAEEERARAEHERRRAEVVSRAKDEFMAILGHELRNPLSPILTALELMRLRADSVLVKERSIIERQVNHMVRLVDDLLDVSRIARGKMHIERVPVELARIVANAIEIASPLIEERSHKLVTAVASSGLLVEGDQDRLTQVVANLLTNAAKYTPAKGLIEVVAKKQKTKVVLTVRDNGIGMERDLLPHIFDVFVQGRQANERAQGGLGLGLAIARNLVEMHGGTLTAFSEGAGKGSELKLELPRIEGMTGDFPVVELPIAVRPGARRILVVDDNVDAAELLREVLAGRGHEVRIAHEGETALSVAAELKPEAALLDIGLPGMDGYELAFRLRAASGGAAPKLIALTGYGQLGDRARSREAGFDEHLVKPVDIEKLESVIGRLFDEGE